jgi:hypothetical protein
MVLYVWPLCHSVAEWEKSIIDQAYQDLAMPVFVHVEGEDISWKSGNERGGEPPDCSQGAQTRNKVEEMLSHD